MKKGWLCDDAAVADCTTGAAKSIAKDGEEANRGDDGLEGEEILNLSSVIQAKKKTTKTEMSYLGVRNTQEWELQQEV